MATPVSPRYSPRLPASATETVDPRWLLKAIAISILAAAVLGYLSVCLLVWQGGWQRLLHPSATVDKTPAQFGLPFDALRFDAAETGRPRLTAWWLPAGNPAAPTILFLHDGDGSLSNTLPTLDLLRRADVNIFAIDYRGYGQSEGPHPIEARMAEDAAAALDYLTDTRHLPITRIVPYGQGLGAPLALNLAKAHQALPAVIVDQPHPEAFERVVNEDRTRLLPMKLLVREHFDIPAALAGSRQPKLLLVDSPFDFQTTEVKANQLLFRDAPDPKMIVTFQHVHADDAYVSTLHRFLDENVPNP